MTNKEFIRWAVYNLSEEDLVKRARENPEEVFQGAFRDWSVVKIKTYWDDDTCKKPSRKSSPSS
jgi:hypothetical protein